MHYWKIESLKDILKENKISEKEIYTYTLIYVVFSVIGIEATAWLPYENPNFWDYTNSIATAIISIAGFMLAYRANGGGQGKDFISRYFSISFVVLIRFIVILVPLFFLLTIFYIYAYPEGDEIPSTVYDTIPFLIWLVFYYCRVYKHIQDVSNS